MVTEGFEQIFKMNKSLSTPLNEWNKACTEMCRRIAQQNIEILEENVSRYSDRLKELSNIRKPEDLINWQKECFDEELNAVMDNTQKFIHASMENMEKFSGLCKSAYGTAHEMATTASKGATRATTTTMRTTEKTAKKVADEAEKMK